MGEPFGLMGSVARWIRCIDASVLLLFPSSRSNDGDVVLTRRNVHAFDATPVWIAAFSDVTPGGAAAWADDALKDDSWHLFQSVGTPGIRNFQTSDESASSHQFPLSWCQFANVIGSFSQEQSWV